MAKSVQQSLFAAVIKLLRPLARILLRNGIPYATFADLAKRVYVDVAADEFGIPGRKQSISRISTLTGIYREQVNLYEGVGDLINRLLQAPDIRVGIISRNITNEPEETLQRLYRRNGVEIDALDFLITLPLKEDKTPAFRAIRETFGINPARAFASGDEKRDFLAAVGSGMHPFMVSYGFESFERLTRKIGIPEELISRHPAAFKRRILHTFDLM